MLEACLRIEGYAGGEGTINAEVQYLEALRFFFADSPFFESLKAGSDEWRLIKDANVRNRHFAQAVDYLARTEAQEAERLARGTEDWVKETIRLCLHQESDAEVVQRGVIAHRILSAWHKVRQGVVSLRCCVDVIVCEGSELIRSSLLVLTASRRSHGKLLFLVISLYRLSLSHQI